MEASVMTGRKVMILGTILLVPLLSVGWCTVRDDLLQSRFNKISPGMSPDQVAGIMGNPSWADHCGGKMPTGLLETRKLNGVH
jgi:hypothetical protein